MKIPTLAIIRNQFNAITVSLVNGFDREEVLYKNTLLNPASDNIDTLYKEFVNGTDEYIINSISLEINNHYKDAKYFDYIKCLMTVLYNRIFTDLCYPNAEKYNVFEEITDTSIVESIRYITNVYYPRCIKNSMEVLNVFAYEEDICDVLVDSSNALYLGNVLHDDDKTFSVYITKIDKDLVKDELNIDSNIVDVFYLELENIYSDTNDDIFTEQIILTDDKIYINKDIINIDDSVDDSIFSAMRDLVNADKEEVMIINKDQSKVLEYKEYIEGHIERVNDAFNKYGKAMCEMMNLDFDDVKLQISDHDSSKYSKEEFNPYRRKFYPTDYEVGVDEDYVEYEFNKAWLHHIHNNPHHPEHWVYHESDGTKTVFDMPDKYIVEMICDWESFRKEDGAGGAYEYYHSGKGYKEGLFTDATRSKVEKLLEIVK